MPVSTRCSPSSTASRPCLAATTSGDTRQDVSPLARVLRCCSRSREVISYSNQCIHVLDIIIRGFIVERGGGRGRPGGHQKFQNNGLTLRITASCCTYAYKGLCHTINKKCNAVLHSVTKRETGWRRCWIKLLPVYTNDCLFCP